MIKRFDTYEDAINYIFITCKKNIGSFSLSCKRNETKKRWVLEYFKWTKNFIEENNIK